MKARLLTAVLLILLCAPLGSYLDARSPDAAGSKTAMTSDQLLLNMLGETRYTLAALVWVKADYYHHEFEFSGKDWTTNTSLMYLIRLVTWLDPHFVQAYDFGGYHLSVNLHKYREAVAFLDEGIRNNPGTFVLLWEKGYILSQQKHYGEAIPPLLEALPLSDQKSVIDEASNKRVWVLRVLSHCYYEVKDYRNTRKYCELWLADQPVAQWPKTILEELKGKGY